MIEALFLRNFQSHKKTDLEFDPGVNVIIGSSDSGKTALIRAIRKLLKNRPSGDAFRSDWGGTTDITVKTEEGNEVTWMKNNTESGYRLNTQTHFKAVGTDVPEEIQQALNLDEINLQHQFDSHFLLTSSPGEVAQHFNKVAKLSKIDTSTGNVNKWIRDITNDKKANELLLKNSEKSLAEYDYLDKFEIEVEVLEGLEKNYTKAITNFNTLVNLMNGIDLLNQQTTEQQQALEDEDLVNTTLKLIYIRDGLEAGPIAAIKRLIEGVTFCEEQLEDIKQLTADESKVNDLLENAYLSIQKEQESITINDLLEEISNTERDITVAGSTIRNKQRQFDKEFPESCPLCGKPK